MYRLRTGQVETDSPRFAMQLLDVLVKAKVPVNVDFTEQGFLVRLKAMPSFEEDFLAAVKPLFVMEEERS